MCASPLALTQTLQVLSSYVLNLSKYFAFLKISQLVSMKLPKNSLQLPKPTRNTGAIANKLMTVASGQKKDLQSKHDLVCDVAKVKNVSSV